MIGNNMALQDCLICDNSYLETLDRCDKCGLNTEQQIKEFKEIEETEKEIRLRHALENIYIKGYNHGVRTVNRRIILF